MKFFLVRQGFVEKSCTRFCDVRAQVERHSDERQLSSPEVSFFTSSATPREEYDPAPLLKRQVVFFGISNFAVVLVTSQIARIVWLD